MFSPMAKAETPLPTSKGRVVGQESLIGSSSDNTYVSRKVLSQLQTNRLASVESQNGLLPAKTPRKANSTTKAAASQEQSLSSPKTNLTPTTNFDRFIRKSPFDSSRCFEIGAEHSSEFIDNTSHHQDSSFD